MIPQIDGSRKVLGGVTIADLSHIGIHLVIVLLAEAERHREED